MRYLKCIGGRASICCICGRLFAARRYWRRGRGMTSVKTCSDKCGAVACWRAREGERVKPQARACAKCGKTFDVPHQALLQERVDGPSRRHQKYCSAGCYMASIPPSKYADPKEFEREKKRRYRANLRARGFKTNMTPIAATA